MKYNYIEKEKRLKINLDEEIDMNSCRSLRTIVDGYIMRFGPKICELDMSKVTFMDSSGLGFITGRYNLASMLGCKLIVIKPSASIKKVLKMMEVLDKIEVV